MSDDAVQVEILEAEKVIRRLASKLQDAATTAETLALSQQAYSEAGEALRHVSTLLLKTHDSIADQTRKLSASADSLVSKGSDVITVQSKKLSAATDSLVSGTHDLISDQSKKLSAAADSLVSRSRDVITDQSKKLSAAADILVSRTNDVITERSKALWDVADSLQNTNRLMSNTRDAIAKEGKSWGTAASSITQGIDSLKLSSTQELQSLKSTLVEDLKSITTSIGRSPHSIISKLDLVEAQNSKDLREVSVNIRADIQNHTEVLKQEIISSYLATKTGFENADLSTKQLADETQGFLRKIAKNGSYFLWVIIGINGMMAVGLAAILVKLFAH